MSRTIIESNGSKFLGEEVDGIEVLKERLKDCTLHPMFEAFGDFIQSPEEVEFIKPCPELEGLHLIWGNFHDISHVFRVWTNDLELVEELTALINLNKESQGYKDAKRWDTKSDEDFAASLIGEL
jgi:hypothetical protein